MHTYYSFLRFLYCAFSILLLCSCREDRLEEEACNLHVNLNHEEWCGHIFEMFIDEQDDLLVNASKSSSKANVGVEQLTFFIPDFNGTGTYLLAAEDAMYREWLTDLLLECALSTGSNKDQVVVEYFDADTKQIRGKFSFLVTTQTDTYHFEEGTFEGIFNR